MCARTALLSGRVRGLLLPYAIPSLVVYIHSAQVPGNESRVRVASRTAASDRLARSSATSLRSALRSSLNRRESARAWSRSERRRLLSALRRSSSS
jgi:hypothetical protein